MFVVALAHAADLVVDGRVEVLQGTVVYDHVRLHDQGRIEAPPGSGPLRIVAASVSVDASSAIDGGGEDVGIEAADVVIRGTVAGATVRVTADRLTCTGTLAGTVVVEEYDGSGDPCGTGTVRDWDGDGVAAPADCDTRDPAIAPGAGESCNGRDDDCDREVDEESGCPCGVVQYGGHGYELCESTTDWVDARDSCAARGKHLAAMDDAAEDAWFVGVAADDFSVQNWWIGFNDRAVEGLFVWDGGSTSTFTDWNGGAWYGYYGDAEDCVDLRTWGRWADRDCDDSLGWVCESCDRELAFADLDGDGFGDPASPTWACFGPLAGTVVDATDCDDADPDVHPGAADPQGDGTDHDCDGLEQWPTDSGAAPTDPDSDADADVDSDADTDTDTEAGRASASDAPDPPAGCDCRTGAGSGWWVLLAALGRRTPSTRCRRIVE